MDNQTLIQQPSYYNSLTLYPGMFLQEETNTCLQEEINFITTEQLYNAVFENAFHPMFVGTGYGQLLKFNNELLELFGYTEKEMAEMEIADLLSVNEDSFVDFLDQRNKNGIAKAEITAIKKSKERFPCRISSVIYQSDNHEQRSMNTVINISSDLSARWKIAG